MGKTKLLGKRGGLLEIKNERFNLVKRERFREGREFTTERISIWGKSG
ncbi:hypothetical protein GTO10_03550 [Candidatus Saccharibacteria bacterium]|nr:hypothetical protein [Candidatus Saccharibacteria bacterium]